MLVIRSRSSVFLDLLFLTNELNFALMKTQLLMEKLKVIYGASVSD